MDDLLRDLDQIQRLHNLQADYEKTLALLAAIKAGRVLIGNVVLKDGGWDVHMPVPADPQAVPVIIEKGEPIYFSDNKIVSRAEFLTEVSTDVTDQL